MDLNTLWFVLLGVLLAGYAVLDGFDLGAGILHFVGRGDGERRIILNAVGPLWDGNEVWLVTFGGAMFCTFPEAYATAFSGFYAAFMAILFGLIFRAVSIEFRGKVHSPAWRRAWDVGFCVSSLVATFVFGVAVGAAISGVPLNRRGIFVGGVADQINPYSLLVGAMAVTLFILHGAAYLILKTEGHLRERLYGWAWRGWGLFLVAYLLATIVTLATMPHATANFRDHPWAWGIVLLSVLAIANVPRALFGRKPGQAFVSSGAVIASLIVLFGVALFPNLITSLPNPGHSLTIYNAASSQKTLRLSAFFAAAGMPFVIAYTAIVYWTFRGKVTIDHHSY